MSTSIKQQSVPSQHLPLLPDHSYHHVPLHPNHERWGFPHTSLPPPPAKESHGGTVRVPNHYRPSHIFDTPIIADTPEVKVAEGASEGEDLEGRVATLSRDERVWWWDRCFIFHISCFIFDLWYYFMFCSSYLIFHILWYFLFHISYFMIFHILYFIYFIFHISYFIIIFHVSYFIFHGSCSECWCMVHVILWSSIKYVVVYAFIEYRITSEWWCCITCKHIFSVG